MEKLSEKKIVITGGGTAGHVQPVLPVVELLRQKGAQVIWYGSRGGIERQLVGDLLNYRWIATGKWRRYFSLVNLWDILKIPIGFIQALIYLLRDYPALIFAKGGYVSVPVMMAGKVLRIPLVTHESDIILGWANKLGLRLAKKVCVGFPLNAYPKKAREKLIFTGTPAHYDLLKRASEPKKASQDDLLLVMGGSQGAHPINQLIFDSLPALLGQFNVIHLTGKRDFARAKSLRSQLTSERGKKYFPQAFVKHQLYEFLTRATLVISRAGASSLTEIALASKPAVIIPLPSSSGGHQEANAHFFERNNAVVVLSQNSLLASSLVKLLTLLKHDRAKRLTLSRNVRKLAVPDAPIRILSVIESVV